MTVIEQLETALEFDSNDAYLNWEMTRVHRRADAYVKASQDPEFTQLLQRTAEELLGTREEAIEARAAAVSRGVEIPFHAIAHRADLSPLEEEILMICLAPHLSSTLWSALMYAQGNALKPYLEVGFLAQLIEPGRGLLTNREWCEADSALVKNGLLIIEPPRDAVTPQTLLANAAQAPHYVAAAITGKTVVDERLAPFCELLDPERDLFDVILSEETREKVEEFIRSFRRVESHLELGTRPWTLLISGPRGSGKTTLAAALGRAFRRPLFVMHLARVGKQSDSASLIRLAARNARFFEAVLLMVQPELLLSLDSGMLGPLTGLVASYPGLTILEPYQAELLDDAFESLIHFPIEIGQTDADDVVQLWETLLPPEVTLAKDVDLQRLASTYGLTGGQVQAAIEWAQQRSEVRGKGKPLTQADLLSGAKSQVRSKIGNYADASHVKLTMADIVLAEEPMNSVNELVNACRFRHHVMYDWGFGKRLVTGKGLVALFTGEPGTGKTLCAEILANELDLRLHIVSIPNVVSKWVGETERNIRAIFSHARAQNSMLLFDEADALFGTRVKVEKAQDHFQNMEINMLLQEIERFEGTVLLTTNLETNIDRAFERRILFKIDFPNPEQAERERIWQILLPQAVPREDDIDFNFLAETYDLTGGQIKNAIIRAAYQCMSEGTGLTGRALENAAHRQAKAAGKLLRPLDEFD